MTKYFPKKLNTRKNNKNLIFNNKLEIAVIQRGGLPLTRSQYTIIIGKEYAPKSINNEKINFFFLFFF
jgi:hypothetical protein